MLAAHKAGLGRLEETVSLREAHRCLKIWRALWKVSAALGYCMREADPSLGACPSSRCSSLSKFDSTLDYEQALPPLEYRSDVASAAECAGLRSQGPCLAVYRRAGAREPGFQGDRGQLREWARPAAVRSAHDGRVAAARLCEWALFVAADCQSLPRAERFRDDCRARSAGLPNDQRLPQAAFKGARRVVSAGSEVVRGSRAGQTRPRRLGWHEDQSERVET